MPSDNFYMKNISSKIKERQTQIEILDTKIFELRKTLGNETRVEEKLRITACIIQLEAERDNLYSELEGLKKSLLLGQQDTNNTALIQEYFPKENKKVAFLLAVNPIKIKEEDLKETVYKLKTYFGDKQYLDICYKLEIDHEKIKNFLKETKPNIVHFIGYDREVETINLKVGEYNEVIAGDSFGKLFEGSGVECVILNYNYNPLTIHGVTKELQDKVKYIICVAKSINDNELFFTKFYQSIASNYTIEGSFIRNREHCSHRIEILKKEKLDGPIQIKNTDINSEHLVTDLEELGELYKESHVKPYFDYKYQFPYKEEINLISCCDNISELLQISKNIKINKIDKDFELQHRSISHKLFQVQAYHQFLKWNKIKNEDRTCTRLSQITVKSYNERQVNIEFVIQKARYSDQVQSNLMLHWPRDRENWEGEHALKNPFPLSEFKSPSNQSDTAYDNLYKFLSPDQKLTALDNGFLANTLGISIILFYYKNNIWLPLIRNRKKGNNAIFSGLHSSCSFAAEWVDNLSSQEQLNENLFSSQPRKYIKKELGQQTQLTHLIPLAVCREYMRGGKPQLFSAGLCRSLNNDIEKLDEGHYADYEELKWDIERNPEKFTIEFLANWHYAFQFIKLINNEKIKPENIYFTA